MSLFLPVTEIHSFASHTETHSFASVILSFNVLISKRGATHTVATQCCCMTRNLHTRCFLSRFRGLSAKAWCSPKCTHTDPLTETLNLLDSLDCLDCCVWLRVCQQDPSPFVLKELQRKLICTFSIFAVLCTVELTIMSRTLHALAGYAAGV